MARLGDFAFVRDNIKQQKKNVILALHKLIFEEDGDRNNRKRLREFEGFLFTVNDDEYIKKLKYISENLCANDLIAVCSILCISFEGEKIEERIVNNLLKGKLLTATDNEEEIEESEADDNEEENGEDEETDREYLNNSTDKDESIFNEGDRTILPHRNKNRDEDSESERDNDDDSDDDTRKSTTIKRNPIGKKGKSKDQNKIKRGDDFSPKFALSFRDIEDSIRCFDGKSNVPVRKWIKEFEETAYVMHWDDFQKFVFAKKSLKGLAKLFIASESGITSYNKLKRALLEEFDTQTNSAQLHKILREHKKGKDEGVQEYYLKMKEIASRGNIEDSALIEYVIDGITDLNVNKTILYGARNLKQFKEKLKDYEAMNRYKPKSEASKNTDSKKKEENNKSGIKGEMKCFNCGAKGHKSSECKNKEKGAKCFNCNKFGHIAPECPQKKTDASVCILNEKTDDVMIKSVIIETKNFKALFDTGSKCHVMTKCVFDSLSNPHLTKSNDKLIGFGKSSVSSMGQLSTQIEVDGQTFNMKFHVVPSHFLDVDLILGREMNKVANIQITADKVEFTKIENEQAENCCKADILKIDISENIVPEIECTATEYAKAKVQHLSSSYKPSKGKSTDVTMRIVLADESPIFCSPRRLPFKEREVVERQVEQWLKDGVIEASNSDFSSPVVLVKKKDGTPRLCVDYRRINKVIIKDRFPLPLIEDQIDRLQNARIFSTIDLKNGFFHVSVEESSKKYTAFVTHSGQYQFRKVPFGLSNSPSVFQRHVNAIFRDLMRDGIALPYIDDIIIPAMNEDEALSNLEKVFETCAEYGLQINFKKCHFLKKKIEFLGYIIEDGKISPSPRKVEALQSYPIPRNLKQLESFLGLAGYFRKFIPNFSLIAKPLSDLRKKDKRFDISTEALKAINLLKSIMTQQPVLSIFNPNFETEVHTDASIDGYGAVLLQKVPEDNELHPVYYMSRKTSDAEKKYTSYELEVLAIIEAFKKFRVYLLGLHFKLVTDCKAFTQTLQKKDLSTRVARWVLFLQEYDFEVEHRSGSQIRHVDALSRNAVNTIEEVNFLTLIKQAQSQDDELKAIFHILQENPRFEDYFLKGDILHKFETGHDLIVIPRSMQRDVIRRAHEKGHFAIKKTKDLICKEYYIPKLDEKIQRFISCCIPCIVSNRKKGKQEGELHPFLKDEVPIHTYHIDFLGPLESTNKRYNHIFAVVDAFTKFCWLYPTKSTSSKDAISKLEQQSVVFGNPVQIISDRGSAFTSDEFRIYCESQNIKHFKITTGLPRVNGQVERLNAVISAVLAKVSVENPPKWYQHVEKVQQAINSTCSRSTGMTPFELLIGVKMHTPNDIEMQRLVEEELRVQFDEERRNLRRQAKQQILKMQDENRKSFNRKRKKATLYKEGELVVIKRTQFGGGLKLRPKYLGPYQIVKAKSNDTYDVVKSGMCEGPFRTTTCAEYMKPYMVQSDPDENDDSDFYDSNAFEANAVQDGRFVGVKETTT